MRILGYCAAVVCTCGTLVASAQPAVERAAKVLLDARTALGGEQKIAAVKTFNTTGRTRRVQGDNLVPIEFEMWVELPDKYVRKDEIPAQESDPSTNGFSGESLLQIPAPTPPPARPGMPAPPPGQFETMLKQRVVNAKQDFARLMLGMFASSYSAYPLTFSYIGQAEAPQGKADVVEATGPNTVKMRFFVNSDTHLPIMVSWQPPGRPAMPGRGAPGVPGVAPTAPSNVSPPAPASVSPPAPSGASRPAPAGEAAQGPKGPPEFRLYFSDYREVDGLQLPFRLRRALGSDTTEETTFDRFRINTKIDPKRFEVRK